MANLRSTLYAWRDNEAAKKGVELFRVLPSSAIDEIVRKLPKTKEELTAIKGIKDAKFTQYGAAILAMVSDSGGTTSEIPRTPLGILPPDEMRSISYIVDGEALPRPKEERMLFSVSTYLDIVNRELARMRARVKGEVTSFKEQGKAVYFSLRDAEDGSTLSVFMWLSDFALAGMVLTEGVEVLVEGRSEIYKPSGRFSFRADSIQPVGEGAFLKAYNELKKKLESEGLFASERKRKLKEHPVHIGLVTSQSGAVIHDFLSNLGKFGFRITFYDSRVEGAGAVKDILSALTYLESKNLDALVLIRGGGSLESLQAFNNELVVRKIAEFPAVTICAIGHDKDVPLVQLVADYAPFTPTATTTLLNASWEETAHELRVCARDMVLRFTHDIQAVDGGLRNYSTTLLDRLEMMLQPFRHLVSKFADDAVLLTRRFAALQQEQSYAKRYIVEQWKRQLKHVHDEVLSISKLIHQNDPIRQLQLGYSILTHPKGIVRSICDASIGERFEARLADGTLVGELIEKRSSDEK